MLERLLDTLVHQSTNGLFSYSIVVVDNDHLESAKAAVGECAASSAIPVVYCVEPRQSIALARNKAVGNATGDYIAFIDDDEIPANDWLLSLFMMLTTKGVDGVLGPVKPLFNEQPPKWVIRNKHCERPTYPTGFIIDWRKGRTGNVLLKRELFTTDEQSFRAQFRTGEDQDFFRRMIEKGHVFIWCNEALAYEVIPPSRWELKFMLRRALLRGATSLSHPTFGIRQVLKSVIAVPAYVAILPLAFVSGHLTSCLVRLFDHLGRLLAFVGINPISEPYITE